MYCRQRISVTRQFYLGPPLSGAPFHAHGPAFNALLSVSLLFLAFSFSIVALDVSFGFYCLLGDVYSNIPPMIQRSNVFHECLWSHVYVIRFWFFVAQVFIPFFTFTLFQYQIFKLEIQPSSCQSSYQRCSILEGLLRMSQFFQSSLFLIEVIITLATRRCQMGRFFRC
jgi:hypothetical protein